jgi:hypothetical protein
MADLHFEASFGGIPLFLASIETDDGRDIAVQSPSRGDRHYLQDRGARLGKADCEILFVNQPGLAPYVDRFLEFRALVAKGEPQIFVHPFYGAYLARAEAAPNSAEAASQQIRCRCTFLPEDQPQPTTPSGAGVAPIAGAESVSVAATTVDDALAAAGLASSAPSDASSFFDSAASSPDLDPQAVTAGVATLTGQINDAIAELDLATSLDRWPVYQAMVGLLAAVRLAGEAATSDSQQLITVRPDRARALLSICAETYGPDRAVEMSDRVARLNRVRTPNRIPAGTTLKMPAPGAV